MRKFLILTAIMILSVCGSGIVHADIAIAPGTSYQFMKLYESELFGQGFEIERSSQTHLLGVDIKLGNLLLTPKIGIQTSDMEVAEMLDIENDLGLAGGLDIEYDIYSLKGFSLVLMGSYLYSRSEIDEIKINSISFDNPLRNELSCHSWEAGAKITTSLPYGVRPYVGIVYSDSTINLTTDNLPFDFEVEAEAAKNLGLRVGAEISPVKNWNIKLEGKLLDETAILLSTSYRF